MITQDTTRAGASVDPVTAELVRHGLAGAADAMRRTLVRSAFSPIVYEGQDFACAYYDARLRLLAQCQTLPLFQGTLDVCIENALARLGGTSALLPGDMILLNYPWDTGSHCNDMAIVAPAFFDGRHVGYVVAKVHHMDIGAMYPGVTTESRDVWQEGRLYPALKVYEGGKRNEEVYRMLLMNTRTPGAFEGDLNSQMGAARIGLEGLEHVMRRYGLKTFEAAIEALFQHGERHMRGMIRSLPNGRWTARGAHDGGSGGLRAPALYEVSVEIGDDRIIVDLTQAAPQAPGPVNSPRASVVSTVRAAIMSYAGASEVANHGHFQPIEVITKPGTIFDPHPGAPVGLYAFPLIQAMDVVLSTLAQARPGSVPAAGGDVAGFALWGVRENGNFWGGATHFAGGQGASAVYGDGGAPVMSIAASGVRNSSMEAWESSIPVAITKYEYAPDSGGVGRWQGSPGTSVHMKTLVEMDLTSIFERTQTPPFGLEGGGAGRPNRVTLRYPDGHSEEVSRCNRRLPPGTIIEIEMSGGGGYGPPQERDIEAVRRDLRDELITEGWARQHYPHAFEGAQREGAK
jgi:N-methylhydantoinase B